MRREAYTKDPRRKEVDQVEVDMSGVGFGVVETGALEEDFAGGVL